MKTCNASDRSAGRAPPGRGRRQRFIFAALLVPGLLLAFVSDTHRTEIRSITIIRVFHPIVEFAPPPPKLPLLLQALRSVDLARQVLRRNAALDAAVYRAKTYTTLASVIVIVVDARSPRIALEAGQRIADEVMMLGKEYETGPDGLRCMMTDPPAIVPQGSLGDMIRAMPMRYPGKR